MSGFGLQRRFYPATQVPPVYGDTIIVAGVGVTKAGCVNDQKKHVRVGVRDVPYEDVQVEANDLEADRRQTHRYSSSL